MNDQEIVDDDHFKVSFKEDEFLYRVDIEDCNEDHYGKVKVVAKNENGESSKEVKMKVVTKVSRTSQLQLQKTWSKQPWLTRHEHPGVSVWTAGVRRDAILIKLNKST